MLYLISMGLRDEKDVSVRGIEAAKACDSLYAEFYTNMTATSSDMLSKMAGKPVKELDRKGMEDDASLLIEEARKKDVGIFIPGDALSATTHLMLLSEAVEAGVRYKVIHGSSIFTAVAETGLQLYKFGRTVTVTNPVGESTLDAIRKNMSADLHTLALLNIEMDAIEGIDALYDIIKGKRIVAACCLGSDEQVIRYGRPDELLKLNELKGRLPAIIAIPGEMHFTEE
ncbi:MAG: diphthine synthase, partial [Candidatus Aenigmatarchaeota archaeon]